MVLILSKANNSCSPKEKLGLAIMSDKQAAAFPYLGNNPWKSKLIKLKLTRDQEPGQF
jgi:hypothetical protein